MHNGTYGSASKVFDDATKLAEQIAKRWNEYNTISAENAQLRDVLRRLEEDVRFLPKFYRDMMNGSISKAKELLTNKE